MRRLVNSRATLRKPPRANTSCRGVRTPRRIFRCEIWNPRTGGFASLVADAELQRRAAERDCDRAPIPNLHPSGLARLDLRQPALPERLHIQISFCRGIHRSIRLYTATESGKPDCWAARLSNRMVRFILRVPADQPLQIELLDVSGKTLKREQGWFWMRKRRAAHLCWLPCRPGDVLRKTKFLRCW